MNAGDETSTQEAAMQRHLFCINCDAEAAVADRLEHVNAVKRVK
jgi:hypothetical protein